MIYNGLKRIIFVSGGVGRLQMVFELDIGVCQRRGWAPKGVDCEILH